MKKVLFFLIILISSSSIAQISIKHSGSLKELFSIIENKYGYKFMYSNDDIDVMQDIYVYVESSNIESILSEISSKGNFTYKIMNKQIIIRKDKTKRKDEDTGFYVKDIVPVRKSFPVVSDSINSVPIVNADNGEIKQDVIIPIYKNEAVVEEKLEMLQETLGLEDTIIVDGNFYIDSIDSIESFSIIYDSIDNKVEDSLFLSLDTADDNNNLGKAAIERFNEQIFKLNLSSNLLYYVAATPNIGIEMMYKEKFSMLMNGLWMRLDWDDGYKCYRVWAVSPEIRYYFFENKKFYGGAMFNIGQINLKLKDTGSQGNFMGGSLTFGYMVNLSNRLKLNLGVGLGYISYEYETYNLINDVNVKRESGTKSLFVPTKIGVELVWNVNNSLE